MDCLSSGSSTDCVYCVDFVMNLKQRIRETPTLRKLIDYYGACGCFGCCLHFRRELRNERTIAIIKKEIEDLGESA